MIDCALISHNDDLRSRILDLSRDPESPVRLVLDLPETAETLPRSAVGTILDAGPRIVFLDLGESSSVGLRVVKALAHEAPEMGLIVAGPSLTAEALLTVIRAGAGEYLPRPLDRDEVGAALSRVRRKLKTGSPDDPEILGRVTTVFSAKGGTGVTVTAANLAASLRKMTGQSVLLLDLTPSLGTAALALGLQPRYSYLDVIRNFHRIDEELLRSFLEVHEGGVAVLSSPSSDSEAGSPPDDQIRGLVRFCRRHFGHVVVDAGSRLGPLTAAALAESTDRVVVTTADLPTLRNLRRAVELARQFSTNGGPPARVVLNQYREGSGLSPKEVGTALGVEVAETLEKDDDAVLASLNAGRPAALDGRSRFSRGVARLARTLTDATPEDPDGSGLFASLLRPFRSKN